MSRRALLIGVTEYSADIGRLASPLKDIEALQEVLADPTLGGFEVEILCNPNRQQMEETIYSFLHSLSREDLALLYFSGHGIKDDLGKLYFAPTNARMAANELVKPSAVASSWILQSLQESRCARQIVILDCCFSGAFGDIYMGKGGKIDLASQIGGVNLPVSAADRKVSAGRVTLSSSNAVEYSLEDKASERSLYTRFLIEGIRSGKADLDGDGRIEARELHDFIRHQLAEVRPGLSPKIYPWGEGYSLTVSQAVVVPAVPSVADVPGPGTGAAARNPESPLWRAVAGISITLLLLATVWGIYVREDLRKREAVKQKEINDQARREADDRAKRAADLLVAATAAARPSAPVRPAMVIPVPSDCALEFSASGGAEASTESDAMKITPYCVADFHLKKAVPSYLSGEAMGCLDDVGMTMQRDSAMHLVLVGFGTFDEEQPGVTAATRAMTARSYLVRDRGVDGSRIQMRVGPIGLRTVQVYGSDDAKIASRFSCVQSFSEKSVRPVVADAGSPPK